MRRNFCQACSSMKFGVKTRINIPHTCGTDGRRIVPIRHNYIPTKEELEKHLARLKELMEGVK